MGDMYQLVPSSHLKLFPSSISPFSTFRHGQSRRQQPGAAPSAKATASAIGAAGGDPRPSRASLFMGANEGPSDIAVKISGVYPGGKREEDSAHFTNNEGIPWPDP